MSFHLGKSRLLYHHLNLFAGMKITYVSYAKGLLVLGNISMLKIRAHYVKHSLRVIKRLEKFKSTDYLNIIANNW